MTENVIKKKRGRKPKKKNNDSINVNNKENVKNVNSEEKVKKKRGRKPKNKFNIDTNIDEYINMNNNNNNHIIKIPLSSLEEKDDNIKLFNNIDNPPSAYDNENIYNTLNNDDTSYNENYEYYDKEHEFEMTIKNLLFEYLNNEFNKFKYMTILQNIIKDLENITINNINDINGKNINYEIKKKENNKYATINDNSKNNEYYNSKKNEFFSDLNNDNLTQIEILINKKYRHTKQLSLLNSLCNNDDDGAWKEKTNILCFWCCHSFDNIPWGIPIKYINNIFTLSGIYCTPNCAMADLLNNENNNNTMWNKLVLLNLLHHKIYDTDENIVPAPSKITLKAFGGPFSISEYRYLTLNNKKIYNLNFPPCNIIAPILEETKKLTNQDHYFIPADINKINKINENLTIKRRKEKHNKNSLFNFSN